jgi:hypothetical protein
VISPSWTMASEQLEADTVTTGQVAEVSFLPFHECQGMGQHPKDLFSKGKSLVRGAVLSSPD